MTAPGYDELAAFAERVLERDRLDRDVHVMDRGNPESGTWRAAEAARLAVRTDYLALLRRGVPASELLAVLRAGV